MRRVAVLALVLLGLAAPAARADDDAARPTYRALLDRIDLEPAAVGGHRLRVYLSALTLQGQLLDLTEPRTIKAYLGSTELKAPYALGRFGASKTDAAIVVIVQRTIEYADVLPVIVEALRGAALDKLGRVQLAVLAYGEAVGNGRLGAPRAALQALDKLTADDSATEPALLDTLERGLTLLKKATTEPEGRPLRKLVVLIGDGRDKSGDRDRVTRVGKRAGRDGIRIHSFAYSPVDVRRPLLLLGELSKRSSGTFRWLRSGKLDSWTAAFEQLYQEIDQQYVVTFFVDRDTDVAGRRLKIVTTGRAPATSNELKVPELGCNGAPCATGYCAADRCVQVAEGGGRGVLGWLVLVGGLAAGAVAVLGAIGYVLARRERAAAAGPRAPGAPAAPPGGAPVIAPVIAAAAPAASAASTAPTGTGPRLYFLGGSRAGETIALHNGFAIGKAAGNHLLIDDGYTSSTHAQVVIDHFGNCHLYDRGSTNGTFVNGVRVTEYALQHGVTIRIGSTELRFLAQ